MCNALFNPAKKTETIVRDPRDQTLPVPPAAPSTHMLGDGQAKRAAISLKNRKRQIDEAVDSATR